MTLSDYLIYGAVILTYLALPLMARLQDRCDRLWDEAIERDDEATRPPWRRPPSE
jgi:hypothetical protein